MTTTTTLNTSTQDRTNVENDCKEIHDTSQTLTNIAQALATRTKSERAQIRDTYKAMYGEDIARHLQDMRRNTYEEDLLAAALSMWMLNPHERDALVAREAIEEVARGSECMNYMALVEIFVGRKSSHVGLIKQAYRKRFCSWLDQDLIKIEPPNPFQKIILALDTSHKAHHIYINQHTAKCDARRLFETGEGKLGTIEESVVLEIFSKRSIPQLNLTFATYKHIFGHNYTKSFKNEKCGEFEDALKMAVKCMCHPSTYYAKLLNVGMKGKTSSDKRAVSRVMVSRAEVDMEEIQSVFKRKYGMQLRDAIVQTTAFIGADYKDFLVALLTRSSRPPYTQ